MSFISYAQNFEDVMLWRALKHVNDGFYVDIGAQDPELDSVSKAFYDRGWSGINVEPVPHYAERLRQARPRDQTLQCAISDAVGEVPLFVFADTGLSTLQAEQAQRNLEQNDFTYIEIQTTTKTLRDILAPVAQREVHWLKIDVEGAEDQVLSSWKGSRVFPWIVVVESTMPNEKREVYASWEPTLTDAGYKFVYFDGLNRFYVSPSHPELADAFNAPPNVFDDFRLSAVDRLTKSFESAAAYAESLVLEVQRKEDEIQRLSVPVETGPFDRAEQYAKSLEAELDVLREAYRVLDEQSREALANSHELISAQQRSFAEAEAYAKSLELEIEKQNRYMHELRKT